MARPAQAAPSQSRHTRHDSHSGPSQWPGPGIFVKVEFGIALTPTKQKQMSFGYVSRNMDRGSLTQRRPDQLMLRDREVGASSSGRPSDEEGRSRRPHRRNLRSRSAMQLRTSPISPDAVTVSPEDFPLRDYHPFHPEPVFHPSPILVRDNRPSPNAMMSPYRPSPVTLGSYPPLHSNSYPPPQTPLASSSRMPPNTAVRQSTVDRKPLPPLPSHFRLGSDDLPWSSPTIMDPDDASFFEPLSLSPEQSPTEQRSEGGHREDPQRTRELEQLHQAMMGIDSMDLGNEWWEPSGSYDRLGEIGGLPRGPRGVGWAVAVPPRQDEPPSREPSWRVRAPEQQSGFLSPPPAYTQGQWGWDWEWEETYGYWVRVRGLRRSSSVR